MNIFRYLPRPHRRDSRCVARRGPPAGARSRALRRRAAEGRRRSAISPAMPPWSSPRTRRPHFPIRASSRSRSPRRWPKARASRRPKSPGPASSTSSLKPEVFAQVCARRCARRTITAASKRAGGRRSPARSMSNMSRPIRPGPMHVGHGRGAVFGDALANLLAFSGCEVTREYYINDAGAQVDVLARSAFLRYREALGRDDRDSRGALPRRLSQGRRRERSPRPHSAVAARQARERMAADRARHRHRRDDGR